MNRLLPWNLVGTVTFQPGDSVVEIGSFTLPEGADTLWVKVTNMNEPGPWPWSYGILSFRTAEGQPFGSCKAYNSQYGEVFRLGVGLPPSLRAGSLTFEPRGFNLAWIKKGYPWTLRFEQQAGTTSGGGLGGASGIVAYKVSDSNRDIPWVYVDRGLANLQF